MSDFRGFAVSVPGNGHIRREIPCQDASGVWLAPRPCLIVCDGRGSARYSHFGAQAAVKAFRSQCAVLEDLLAAVLDGEKWNDNRWLRFCDLMIRTVCQQKKELSEQYQCPESEFDFTIAFAVWGKERCGFFQVGGGRKSLAGALERSVLLFPGNLYSIFQSALEKGALRCYCRSRRIVRPRRGTCRESGKITAEYHTL